MTNHEGLCVGGPWAGRKLISVDNRYPLTRMKPDRKGRQLWSETGRGEYQHDAKAGVWWWKGWEKIDER